MFQSTNAVKKIFYLNLIMFLLTMFKPHFMFQTFSMFDFNSQYFVPYQFITYQFMHQGFMHILFNMLVLLSFAPFVEEFYGEKKTWIYYLLCGISGSLLHVLMTNSGDIPLVGASASLWGMLVMFTLLRPNEKVYLFFLLGIKAKYIVSILFLIEVLSALIVHDRVSHYGHIGGALMGLFLYLNNKYATKLRSS